MAVSLNSVVGVNPTHVSRSSIRAAASKAIQFKLPLGVIGSRIPITKKGYGLCLSVSDNNCLASDRGNESSRDSESSFFDNQVSAVNTLSFDSSKVNSQLQTSADVSEPQTSEATNGSVISSDQNQNTSSPNQKFTAKRLPLTPRERLRAARFLSRYTETKTSKSEMGTKVLDALKESDSGKKKKRSGLPEAPTNLFDDNKRGMPKAGLTFQFPGGVDLFVIVFSFVFISTVMFATTYLVWKVGAIHFNEY